MQDEEKESVGCFGSPKVNALTRKTSQENPENGEDRPLLQAGQDSIYQAEQLVFENINGTSKANLLYSIYSVPIKVNDNPSAATPLYRKRHESASAERHPRPAVLLIHGWAQNHFSFHITNRSFHNYLAQMGFDVFAIDQRGTTKLSKRMGGIPAISYADSFQDILTAIDLVRTISGNEKIFLVGHSFGGALCCGLAGEIPNKIRGIICIAGLYGLGNNMAKIRLTLYPLIDIVGSVLPKTCLYPIRKPAPGLAKMPWLAYRMPGAVLAKDSLGVGDMKEYFQLSMSAPSVGLTKDLLSFRNSAKKNPVNHAFKENFAKLENMPYLGVAGRSDWLVNCEDSRQAFEESRSNDKKFIIFDDHTNGKETFGHCDIIIGSRAPAVVWPELANWLRDRLSKDEKVLSVEDMRLDLMDPTNPKANQRLEQAHVSSRL